MKRVGLLTGGGDAPGLNAVIRGAVVRLSRHEEGQFECVGILDGWKGLRDNLTMPLPRSLVDSLLHQGGTVLGTSRTNLYKKPDDVKKAVEMYKKLELDALIAIGGDDTLEIAYYLQRDYKLNTVGVPKTIDNDVLGTDFTFGFWSSVEQAVHAIDNLRVTAASHHRIMVVECMGRHAGWITAYTGLASEAVYIVTPERPADIKQIAEACVKARKRGKMHSIVVVAEGASIAGLNARPHLELNEAGEWSVTENVEKDSFGNAVIKPGEIAEAVSRGIEKITGIETRGIALGHLQRGGSPAAYDRVLGTRYGIKAAEAVILGQFGYLVRLNGLEVEAVAMKGMLRENQKEEKRYKYLPLDFLDMAEYFFG